MKFLQKRVFKSLLDCYTFVRIKREHFFKKVYSILRNAFK
jgi:hypothetical protein